MPRDLPRQQFVLDTSLFVTEGIREEGESLEEAVLRLLDLAATARLEFIISRHMPPSIHDELVTMLRDRDVGEEVFSRLDTWVVRKSPDRYGVAIPADIVYDFIDEMSDRVNRGLRVSEEAIRGVEGLDPEEPAGDDRDYVTEVDRVLSDMREKYRRALRQGVLDSREDFNLLVLARDSTPASSRRTGASSRGRTSSGSGTSAAASSRPCWRSTSGLPEPAATGSEPKAGGAYPWIPIASICS